MTANNTVNAADRFHERKIAMLTKRMIDAIRVGRWDLAHNHLPELRLACLSRSPAQVVAMEQRIFRRAA